MPERSDQPWAASHLFECPACSLTQLPIILGTNIRQCMLLPVGPDVLDRVQFRRIGGEVLDPPSLALPGNKIASELAFVGGQAVPDDPQRSWNVAQQRLQKVHPLRALDRALLQSEIEVKERDPGRRPRSCPSGSCIAKRESRRAATKSARDAAVGLSRFHRRRGSCDPSFWAFFYLGPAYPPPAADLFLLPLARSSHRTLTTPARIVQDLPDMAGMILDTELVVDPMRHPRAGPKRGFLAQLLRAF